MNSDFANPPIEEILRANPMLQWRKCWGCDNVAIYRDNILPACKCRECGSADTRPMVKENKLLHRVS